MKNHLLASLLGLLLVCLPATGVLAQSTTTGVIDVVCLDTTLGEICIRLFPEDAPQTVANFLKYVSEGDYNGVMFHRSVPGFVVQSGGYIFNNAQGALAIPKDPNVINEFKRSNTRGTVAMAKLGSDPNSANSEWFINLGDNSQNLNNQNGGFTVFGEVVIGWTVVESIARLPSLNISNILGSAFESTPLLGYDNVFTLDDFVTISRAYPTQRDLTPVPTPEDPFPGVATLANYGVGVFEVPVQWTDGNLYRMYLVQDTTKAPPQYVFKVDTLVILKLVDKGQARATFDGQFLTVPSIRVGVNIFTRVRLKLTDSRTLEFSLVDFTRYTGVEPL